MVFVDIQLLVVESISVSFTIFHLVGMTYLSDSLAKF